QRCANLSLDTLKGVYALGHEIVSASPSVSSDLTLEADSEVAALAQRIESNKTNLAALLAIWREREEKPAREVWSRSPVLYRRLAERLLGVGAPGLAHEVVLEGLDPDTEKKRWPGDLRLRQLEALALLRMGSPERTLEILEKLATEAALETETLGILASAHKN